VSVKVFMCLFLFFLVLLPLTVYVWKKVPILLPVVFTLLIGVFLNTIVVCANGYKMPVVVSGDIIDSDIVGETHFAANEGTKFVFLADHIHVTSPILGEGHTRILSIGDVFIHMGTGMIFVYCILFLICDRFQGFFPKITEMMREL